MPEYRSVMMRKHTHFNLLPYLKKRVLSPNVLLLKLHNMSVNTQNVSLSYEAFFKAMECKPVLMKVGILYHTIVTIYSQVLP